MGGATSLTGHAYMQYADAQANVPNAAEPFGKQSYALEVNGKAKTIAIYVKDASNQYVMIDESAGGTIAAFKTGHLGVYFYLYYANQTAKISNVYIARGLTAKSGVKARTPGTTPPAFPVTTAKPGTDAPLAATTNAPATAPKTADLTAVVAGLSIAATALGCALHRKKK